ncbi:MAG TPA: hypothetical protein VM658_08910 [bacterium]|nr:hypothetical protein [bacterium]
MSPQAKVWIEKNAYRIKGEFSTIEPNTPIRREDGKLCGVTNPRRVVHIHSYGGEAPFFAGLAEGKLIGTRCVNQDCASQGTMYLPFRIHCPECLAKMKPVDLTRKARNTAKIYSYIVTSRTGAFNALDVPIRFIDVEVQGVATIIKSYQLIGEPAIGARVVPIFRTKNPTYTITDLAWVAKGTPPAKLPKGFTF